MSEDIPWKTDPNWRPPPEPPKPPKLDVEPGARPRPTPRPAPPWAAIPELPWGSLGWRMGGGEEYLYGWSSYVDEHLTTRTATLAHLQKYPPAPHRFRMRLMSQLRQLKPEPGISGEAEQFWRAFDAALEPRDSSEIWRVLRRWNLLADDAAYPAFVRNAQETGMPPPWIGYAGSLGPAYAMKLNPRATGWWARWMFETKADLEAQLAAHPPNELWNEAIELIRQRIDPAWERGCRVGAACLIASMVVHGTLPPPWSREQPPTTPDPDPLPDVDGLFGRPPPPPGAPEPPALPGASRRAPEPDDRQQWTGWAFETFDDPASWRAYLDRWPPPEEWSVELQKGLLRELNRE